MNIIVNSDRTVEKTYVEKDGSQNENRATKLNFTLPEEYSSEGFVPKIAFITEDGNFSDYINNGEYILKNNITKYRDVICFVWITNSAIDFDFRSQTFSLNFYYNEVPSDYIPSEQEKSQIELLMEELDEKIQEVTELEENVYTKDETYSKEETYNKQEIDSKVSSVYKYKGAVATYNNLPSTGLTIGDVYNVEDTGDNYAWTGTDWDKLGGNIDLSGYQEKIDNSHKLNADLVDDSNSINKFTNTAEKNSWNGKYTKPSSGIPKSDLSEEVQEDLEKADEALEEIETIEEDLYGNIDVEAEESSIKLSGTKDGRNISVKKIYGNSTQIQYEGKNRLNASAETYSFEANIQETKDIGTIQLEAGQAYYISYNVDNNSSSNTRSTPTLRLSNYTGDTYYESANTNYNLTKGRKVWQVSPTVSGEYLLRYWVNDSNIAVSVSDFMVSTSSDTTYEPYTNNLPVPNPTQKSDINNVEGDVSVLVRNKNFCPKLVKGIGIYPDTGVQYISANNATSDFIPVNFVKNSYYYLSGLTNRLSSFAAGYNANKEFIGRTSGSAREDITLSANSFTGGTTQGTGDIVYIRITQYEISTSIGTIDEVDNLQIQLEIGSTATSYVPHAENTATFPLKQGQKLMLGDYLADDGVHHKRGQYMFTGNEVWTKSSAYTTSNSFACYTSSIIPAPKINATNGLLNIGNVINVSQMANYDTCFGYNTNANHFLKIIKTAIPNWDESATDSAKLALFKAYLAQQYANGTPVTVEYELATETVEAYTPEQQEAYNKLQKMKQYDDITYITIDKVNKFDLSYDGDRIAERDEEIDSLKSKNALLLADHPDITGTGTDVTLNGTGDLPMEVDVGGNSTQIQYEGYNKLSAPTDFNRTVNNITVQQSGGIYKLNGTASQAGFVFGETFSNQYTIQAGDYLQVLNDGISNNAQSAFNIGFTDNTSIQILLDVKNKIMDLSQYVGKTTYVIRCYCENGATLNNVTIKPMIVNSSTQKDFEPYTNGLAVPNPTQKSNINNVEGDVEVKGSNINIWDEESEPGSLNYTTGLKENDISRIRSKNYIKVSPNTTYYMLGGISAGRECFYDKEKKHISSTSVYNNTFTTPNNAYYMMFTTGPGYGITYKNDICLNLSNTNINGNYVPHQENSVTFPLAEGQKLMLGDTLEDGKIIHRYGEYIVTGNEPISSYEVASNGCFAVNLGIRCKYTVYTGTKTYWLATHLMPYALMELRGSNSKIGICILNDGYTYVNLTGDASTIETVRELWRNLAGMKIYYLMKEETIDPYTPEQQTAYNKLKEMQSYYDLTYVSGSSDNAQPILTAHARKSLKVMQNEIDELKQAILNI